MPASIPVAWPCWRSGWSPCLLALDFAADGDLLRPISLALLGLFAVMLAAFVAVERRVGERALLPRDVMADRTFRATCVAGIFMSIPLFAVMLFLPQYFSKVQGYGAFAAGVALLPLMVAFALTSFVAAANAERVDRWLVASIGAAAQCVGIFMLSFLDSSDGYLSALGGMVVLGIGIGLFNSAATAAAVTSLHESRASLGGAVLYMFQVAGGTVGLALTTAVFALVSHQSLQSDVDQLGGQASAQELRDLQGVLAGTESSRAVQLALPSDAATEVAVATDAFDAGLQWAFRLDALLVVAGVGITTHMARSQRRAMRPAGGPDGDPVAPSASGPERDPPGSGWCAGRRHGATSSGGCRPPAVHRRFRPRPHRVGAGLRS